MNQKWHLLVLLACCCDLSIGQCPSGDSVIRIARSQIEPQVKLLRLLDLNEQSSSCSFDDSLQAIITNTIGALYCNRGNYLEAIRYIKESIQFVKSRLKSRSINPAYLVSCYANLSRTYDSLRNTPEKIRALDTAVNIGNNLKLRDPPFIYVLINKADYYYSIGDYTNCLSYAELANELSIEYPKTHSDPYQYGIRYATISSVQRINALLALQEYARAINFSKEQIQEYKKNKRDILLGTAYGQLANIESRISNFSKSQSYFDTALRYAKYYKDINACKVLLNNIGTLKEKWYKNENAGIPYYIQSFQYKDPEKPLARLDSIENLNALCNLGSVYTTKKKFDSAFYYFNLAYRYFGKGWNEEKLLRSSTAEFSHVEKFQYVIKLLIDKAYAYSTAFKATKDSSMLNEALRMYFVIDKLMFRIKMEQSSPESKLAWRTQFHELYENAIGICQQKNDRESALYFFERSKAILLFEQLSEERWTSGYEIMKQNQVKREIQQLNSQIESNDNSSTADSLKRELIARKGELETLRNRIRVNNPLYYQYAMDTSSITLKDIRQKLLKDHDAFLEMFSGDSSLYVLLVTRENAEIKKIERARFDTISNSFIQCLSNSDFSSGNHAFCTIVSSSLFHLLFDGFDMPKGRVIISPDGKYFPFEALVVDQRNGHLTYFLNDHAVSYTYSARYLLNPFTSNPNLKVKNVMGVAPVQYDTSLHLPNLDGSDVSIKNVLSHFSSVDKYLGGEATRSNFLNNFYRYRVLQLYTHASESGFNKEPVIYFADSALMLSDLLYENPPATQLIVLSGCETGAGQVHEGEGVFSFNRAFAGLGVPSCVANLWQVENTSTYQLTELFYAKLAKGLPLDVAMQQAKKEFHEHAEGEKQLPYYWAAPILTGRTEAIELKKNYTWIFIAAGACVVAFIIVALVLPRVRRNVRVASS